MNNNSSEQHDPFDFSLANDESASQDKYEEFLSKLNDIKNEIKDLLSQFYNDLNEMKHEDNNTNQPSDINDSTAIQRSIRRTRKNRHAPLNTSKNLSSEQRTKVINFMNQEEVLDEIRSIEPTIRMHYVKEMIHDKLDINLSMYMVSKLLNVISL